MIFKMCNEKAKEDIAIKPVRIIPNEIIEKIKG